MTTDDPSGPAAPFADAIRASYPIWPYLVVISALIAAYLGTDASAWQPLLLAGAVLIDPKPSKGSGQ